MVIQVKIVNAFVGVGMVVAKRGARCGYTGVFYQAIYLTLYRMLYFNEKVYQKTSFHTKHFPI